MHISPYGLYFNIIGKISSWWSEALEQVPREVVESVFKCGTRGYDSVAHMGVPGLIAGLSFGGLFQP